MILSLSLPVVNCSRLLNLVSASRHTLALPLGNLAQCILACALPACVADSTVHLKDKLRPLPLPISSSEEAGCSLPFLPFPLSLFPPHTLYLIKTLPAWRVCPLTAPAPPSSLALLYNTLAIFPDIVLLLTI